MADKIQTVIRGEKIAQLTLQGMKRTEIAKIMGVHRNTISNYTREMKPEIQEKAAKVTEFLVNQKIELMKLRKEIFEKVLKQEIIDDNFYRQLRAAAESAKQENEGLLIMQRISGKEETEVREDVWGTLLQRLEKREIELGGRKDSGTGSEQAESAGDEGEVCEEAQQ